MTFAGDTGTLVIKHPLMFDGQIAGISGGGDVIDLKHFNVAYTTEMSNFDFASDTTALTVTNGIATATLTLDGNYSNFAFNIAPDGHHEVDITGTPDAGPSYGGSVTGTTGGAITNVGILPALGLTPFDNGGVVVTAMTDSAQIALPEISPNTPVEVSILAGSTMEITCLGADNDNFDCHCTFLQ